MSTIKVTNLQNASAASPAIVLDANSRATLNGLSYPTEGSLSGRNRIINGDMRIDQRNAGASVTAPADGYAIDRWKTYLSGGGAMTVQRSTTAPAVFTNSQLFTVTTADTSLAATDAYGVQQMIEGFNSADLAWGTASASAITVSFWVRSSVTGTYTLSIRNNADTRSYLATYSVSAANTFEYKTITIPGDTSGTWLTDNGIGIRVWFDLGAGSTYTGSTGAWSSSVLTHATGGTNWIATSGATFYITGVQLEAGSVATPFERRSYGQELALCQRYFCSFGGSGNYENYGTGWTTSTTNANTWIQLPTSMRGTPSVSYIGNLEIQTFNNAGYAISSLATSSTESNSLRVYMSAAVSGATANVGCIIRSAGDINARLRLSAEL